MGTPSAYSDAELLLVLELRRVEGLTFAEIAKRLRRSRGSVIGVVRRIDREAGPGDRHDGTMPPGWWRDGLARQAALADG